MTNRPDGFSAVTQRVLSRKPTGSEPLPNGFSAVKAYGCSAVTYPVLSRDLTGSEPLLPRFSAVTARLRTRLRLASSGQLLQVSFSRLAFLGQPRNTAQLLQVSLYSDDMQASCVPAERGLASDGLVSVAEDKDTNKTYRGEQA